jgi:S-adenosylmethionine:tRNA ribosyltransferase-isomerase
MKVELFNYNLPKEKIAQAPVRPRERAKMLYFNRETGSSRDFRVSDLPNLIRAGDLLVFNVTKVRHARLQVAGIRGQENIKEVLILKPLEKEGKFECLIRGKNIEVGQEIMFGHLTPAISPKRRGSTLCNFISSQEGEKTENASKTFPLLVDSARRLRPEGEGQGEEKFTATIISKEFKGIQTYIIQTNIPSTEFLEFCESTGELPLPPYIHNDQIHGFEDELYQPITAKELGSVAAPTASLHFSQKLLDELKDRGVKYGEVILHVGLGTFLPVKVDDTEDHKMHSEQIEVSEELLNKIKETKENGGRVIAIGTTVARALESVGTNHPELSYTTPSSHVILSEAEGSKIKEETSLFITPGYEFKVIDGLLTNFHMPKSTLLMMVSAFLGRDKLFDLYDHALTNDYRFLSFGDCMLIL